MAKIIEIYCENCFIKFETFNKNRKYCSRKCFYIKNGKNKTLRKTFSTKCSWCEKEITKSLSTKGKIGDFCSQKCSQSFKRGYENKYITKVCPECNKEFEKLYRKQTTFCSRQCSLHSRRGKNHPLYGKKFKWKEGKKAWTYGLTAKTDERIAKLGKKISKIQKKQFEDGIRDNSGENNPNHNNNRKNKVRTQEQLDNYSAAAIRRMIKYDGFKRFFEKGKYYSKKMDTVYSYRSSYEKRYMRCLDEDKNIVSWEYEPYYIKYTFNGKPKRYLIDFIIYNSDSCIREIIEIKCEYKKNDEINLIKAEAGLAHAVENKMNYSILVLEDIKKYEKNLGIING